MFLMCNLCFRRSRACRSLSALECFIKHHTLSASHDLVEMTAASTVPPSHRWYFEKECSVGCHSWQIDGGSEKITGSWRDVVAGSRPLASEIKSPKRRLRISWGRLLLFFLFSTSTPSPLHQPFLWRGMKSSSHAYRQCVLLFNLSRYCYIALQCLSLFLSRFSARSLSVSTKAIQASNLLPIYFPSRYWKALLAWTQSNLRCTSLAHQPTFLKLFCGISEALCRPVPSWLA